MNCFTFNINDFKNKKIAPFKLENEIRKSDITIALDRIDCSLNSCNIYFKTDLSEIEENILNQIVLNHQGLEDPFVFDNQGRLITVPTATNFGDSKVYFEKGFKLECEANKENILDIEFDRDVLLFGGDYCVLGNPNLDDYLQVEIYIQLNGEKIVVGVFSETRYVKFFPSGSVKRQDVGYNLKKDYKMGIRLKYVSTGLNPVILGFVIEAW